MLRMSRRRGGLSQRALSRRSGVPQPTISRIERGRMSPTLDTLLPLVRACGMDLEAVQRLGEGCDVTLVREVLKMSPAERLRFAARTAITLDAFRRGARRVGTP
jgi:transcriptional regulator with XRE-family HTH domain